MSCLCFIPTPIFARRSVVRHSSVQADNLETGLPQIIVAMISSNLARAGHRSRVLFKQGSPEGIQMGLHSDSLAMTDNLATVFESEIDRAIGSCPDMLLIDDALRHTLGL